MIAIVLGSGLSSLTDFVQVNRIIRYDSFTDFNILPLSGHDHIIYEAQFHGKSIIILSGKFHLYEGYNYEQSIAPLKYIARNYQITQWIVTSASGALSSSVNVGEWQLISGIVTLEQIKDFSSSVVSSKIAAGVTYGYQKGPSLGTVAEYNMMKKIGADLVGMSMLPESIYLRSIEANTHLYSLPVCSYHPIDYYITEPSHEQVITLAARAVSKLLTILQSILKTT